MAEDNRNQLRKEEQEIKSAISSPLEQPQENMEPSMANQQQMPQDYYQTQGPEYAQYQDQQGYSNYGISSDTVNEIAEEVVAEKFFSIKKELDKVIEFRTSVQAKIEYLDERLKRVEKIIERLQLSVLQKVGDYITNVEDIKKELTEMGKTFKSSEKTKK